MLCFDLYLPDFSDVGDEIGQLADGANCLCVGHLGTITSPLALVGGNCSIHGFDYEGNDAFWTVSDLGSVKFDLRFLLARIRCQIMSCNVLAN